MNFWTILIVRGGGRGTGYDSASLPAQGSKPGFLFGFIAPEREEDEMVCRMSRCRIWCAVLATTLLAVFSALRAGTTGKITGVVRDERGRPLPGVAVQITGLRLGGVTDADGAYSILQVPPGTHEVQANMVGFRTLISR
ncbi:MAG TPA: carboxypeptidase-like regulatory domain-containing protein, partial [Candidatus Latescibacteria bacterium]|nr:carboxypeptidase-like regulatory domain-containing protein [Candidatus Latescibacterota bacterium]